ncbi:hypothetical protein [Roseateles sp.]|uniref:hypothetical protein n=1 Tax=Roseateles sp. TaxID=1971397 RepID=UPI002F40C47A
MTAPRTAEPIEGTAAVRPRTYSSAAERRFDVMCDEAIHELDPDRAYERWLEHEAEIGEVLEMIRTAVGGAARDLLARGDSQQEIADRHALKKRTVQTHAERAPIEV